MIYAKIDDQGNVLEFPYDFERTIEFMQTREVPTDAVEVDIVSNRPNVAWDEVYDINEVIIEGDAYVATFTTRDRFTNDDDKLKGITTLKRIQTQQNYRTFTKRVADLKAKYPDAEVQSWDQQRREAEAYTLDNTATTPLLSVIADARGITVSELTAKVIANATAYDASYGEILGKYQRNRDLLNVIDFDDNTTWDNIDSVERF